ncbi:MAG: hypothetical protein SF172_04275 [Burkholderiales bacterium]|nr:hypothetical protein [Burkholderiales bacterium]
MSFQVLCTFDLKHASSADYERAYEDLRRIGLARVQKGTSGDYVIPTTTVLGKFTGSSLETVRDYVRDQVKAAFKARGFRSEIFVVVGRDGTWGSATT